MDGFKKYRILELKKINSNFSISTEMQKASMNSLWKNKEALWVALSGICDEAAQKCYEKINNFVNEVIDVETCNINSLISMAKSVDAEFLINDLEKINEEDVDIFELINLLSIPKELLLNSNLILNPISNDKQYGALTLRSSLIDSTNVSVDLLWNIKKNILNLKKIFELNLIDLSTPIINLLNYDLPGLNIKNIKKNVNIILSHKFLNLIDNNIDEIDEIDEIDLLKILTLNDIIDKILNFNDDYNFYKSLKLFTNDKKINYFYILINVIKQNYYNEKTNSFMITTYFDKNVNYTINLFNLILSIVGIIYNDNDVYLYNFICFHFYGLIQDKIKNENIRSLFLIKNNKIFNNNKIINDYSKEEFISYLIKYLSIDDANKFIEKNNIIKFTKPLVDFVNFLNKINSLNINDDFVLFYDDKIKLDYDLLKINYSSTEYKNNNYDDILYGIKNFNIKNKDFQNIFVMLNNTIKYNKSLYYDYIININYNVNDNIIALNNQNEKFMNFIEILRNSLKISDSEINDIINYLSIKYSDNNYYINTAPLIIDFLKEWKKYKLILKKYNLIPTIDKNKFKFYQIFYNVHENYDIINNIFTFLENGLIIKVAKKYTNLCVNIRYIRESIKTIIQQYGFIGTKRVATDILFDFFIKNYSKKQDWNYITNDYILSGNYNKNLTNLERPLDELVNGSISFTNNMKYRHDDEFSIDVVEYYDTTQYLNIKSDLPMVEAGRSIVGFDKIQSAYIDENYEINYIEDTVPIYETIIKSGDLFIKNYNDQFWKNNYISFGNEHIDENNEKKILFYNNYQISKNNNYITLDSTNNKNISELLFKIWDEFSLSGLASNEVGEFSNLYKKYIYSYLDEKFYENYGNNVFPTIAALQNINGLIKISDYDEKDLLFVSKIYYDNVYDKLKLAIRDMLLAYDKNGVPDNGWRQTYITFNGYSTDYEISDNKLLYSTKIDKVYKTNGPFEYSSLQFLIYNFYKTINQYKNNWKDHYDEFLNDVLLKYKNDYSWDFSNNLFDKYSKYFKIENNEILPKIIFNDDNITYDNSNCIFNKKITQVEEDLYGNYFTLFKNEGDKFGKIWFRSYNMPISLPIIINEDNSMFFNRTSLKIINLLNNLCNNCYEFGIFYKTLWIFGKIIDKNNDNKYMLCSCQFEFNKNNIILDESTFQSYCFDNDLKYLNHFNDYVGTFYQDDSISFILFDTEKSLLDLNKMILNKHHNIDYNSLLFNSNMSFIIFTLNVYKNFLNKKLVNTIDISLTCQFPMLLEWDDKNNRFNTKIYGDSNNVNDRLWSLTTYSNKCYIGYMSLNKKLWSVNNYEKDPLFLEYFNFESIGIRVETLTIKWPNNKYKADDEFYIFNTNENEYIEFIRNDNALIYLDKNSDEHQNINKFKNFYSKISNCYVKNNESYNEFGPLSFGYVFEDSFYDKLIGKILNVLKKDYEKAKPKYNNIVSFQLIFDIFSGSNINSDNIIDNEIYEIVTNSTGWKLNKTYNKNNPLCKILDILNNCKDNKLLLTNNSDESIFNMMNNYYNEIPALTTCCLDKLKVSIFFNNDSGISFINDGVIDLDITCYINDIFEKDNKVGYGNKFKKTKYISWTGDKVNGGSESIEIDVDKYIYDKALNDTINTNMEIVFNLCWNENSQITPSNVYALINWQNLVEKYHVDIIGTSLLDCKSQSFSIIINKNTKNILVFKNKLYGVLKINYKEKLEGYAGSPDIEFGFLNSNEDSLPTLIIEKSLNKVEFLRFNEIIDVYYYKHKNTNSISFIFPETYFITSNNYKSIMNLYKTMIKELSLNHIFDKINIDDSILETQYFDPKFENLNEINSIMNYVIFLNPLYFSDRKNFNFKVKNVFNFNVGRI